MKKTVKKVYLAAIAITALAGASASLADTYSSRALGASAVNFEPTDVYGLTCPPGTASVRARGWNPNGSPSDELSIQVINRATGQARTVISLEGVTPPTAVLAGGAGNYLVAVHKSPSTAMRYTIFMDCYTASSAAIAGVQSRAVQNQ